MCVTGGAKRKAVVKRSATKPRADEFYGISLFSSGKAGCSRKLCARKSGTRNFFPFPGESERTRVQLLIIFKKPFQTSKLPKVRNAPCENLNSKQHVEGFGEKLSINNQVAGVNVNTFKTKNFSFLLKKFEKSLDASFFSSNFLDFYSFFRQILV